MGRSRCLIVLLCGIAGFRCAAFGETTIYSCTDTNGHHTYSDRGCPDQQVYQPPASPAVRFVPIPPADLQRLENAARQRAERKRAQNKARTLRREAQREAARAREQTCRHATEELAAIALRRRKGYSLAAQPDLDDARAELKRRKRANC